MERLTLRSQTFMVAWSALLVSLFALAYCYSRGMLLLYGDAVAHLHIARRVFDSLNPGLAAVGFRLAAAAASVAHPVRQRAWSGGSRDWPVHSLPWRLCSGHARECTGWRAFGCSREPR